MTSSSRCVAVDYGLLRLSELCRSRYNGPHMSLTSGTKLGPYEIQSPLGSGGMGEVYRAKDTRLDRTVAVKVLPSHLSENPEARQRFDREARSISSLNHPNICTLHDVGHQDGIDYLVMEYLEGETLADRLRKGPLTTEGSLSGETPRQIIEQASKAEFSEGYLLYLRQTVLVAQHFDPKSLKLSGDPVPVAEKLDYWNARDLAAFTTAHGTLVYRHASLQKTQPMWVDHTGKEVGRFGEPGLYVQPHASPDGSLVGFVRSDPDTGKGDVWVVDTVRNTVSRSTFADAGSITFAFSPDAKRIAVGTIAGAATGGMWIQPTSGSGTQEKIDTPKSFGNVNSWSPNGRYLFLMVQNDATRQDVYYIDLAGDKKLTPFIQTRANETNAELSPNGKWLAYQSDESGRYEVYVMAFPESGSKYQLSSGGGGFPSWSADGRQLYYTNGDKLMSVPISNLDNFQFGAPSPLPIHVTEFAAVGPAAPGDRFPALKPLSGGRAHPQEVIFNWVATLKQ
jgi:hypothetical protein